MSTRILIVDDSTTIQKVISIMLASEPYELVQCYSEEELKSKYSDQKFNLVLLDFGFSSRKVGYELIREVHGMFPDCPILMMLGTFDNVDESLLFEAGAKDKIIKPFESSVFLQKCFDLVERVEKNEENDITSDSEENDLEQWVVNAPEVHDNSVESIQCDQPAEDGSNSLFEEVEGWGIDVPGVIGAQEPTLDLDDIPGVISSETPDLHEKQSHPTNDAILPTDDNLEYPKIEDDFSLQQDGPSSTMISIDDLSLNEDGQVEESDELKLDDVSEESWEKEVLQEQDSEEFWSGQEHADECTKPTTESSDVIFNIPQEESENSMDHDIDQQKPLDEIKSNISELDYDELAKKVKDILDLHYEKEIIEKVKSSIPPIIEEYIRDHCKEAIERIAWDVIPDLAENLIKKEIKDISDSIS